MGKQSGKYIPRSDFGKFIDKCICDLGIWKGCKIEVTNERSAERIRTVLTSYRRATGKKFDTLLEFGKDGKKYLSITRYE